MTPSPVPARPRVVIVGGGFGGLSAARALEDAPVDITLVDRTNHHLFQSLLYQAATGVLSPADLAVPLRHLLRRQQNATVLLAEVVCDRSDGAHRRRRKRPPPVAVRLPDCRDRRAPLVLRASRVGEHRPPD